MKRVWVVGTTGSGKSTLAREVARRLHCEHVELDSIYWGANWKSRGREEFLASLAPRLEAQRWVVDGNYRDAREYALHRADTLVWLDLSIGTVLTRLSVRSLRRSLLRQELWNGNRERLWIHLFTRKSLLLWALQTHWRRRREYSRIASQPRYRHLQTQRILSPAQAGRWLASVPTARALQGGGEIPDSPGWSATRVAAGQATPAAMGEARPLERSGSGELDE